jgi:hypothetical protein
MGGAYRMNILVRKQEKRAFRTPRNRWEGNKIYHIGYITQEVNM